MDDDRNSSLLVLDDAAIDSHLFQTRPVQAERALSHAYEKKEHKGDSKRGGGVHT